MTRNPLLKTLEMYSSEVTLAKREAYVAPIYLFIYLFIYLL